MHIDAETKAKVEKALQSAGRWADILAKQGPCEKCDPGNEGVEVMGAIADECKAALEKMRALK